MDFAAIRNSMVKQQLIVRGIKDERVLSAFLNIPRHEFVAPELVKSAYEDCPLPIGSSQTISQPYMVAIMTELLGLKGSEKVLELGTGSGYQTAVLARLAAQVYSLERIERLAKAARERLEKLKVTNVNIITGDGTLGLEEHRPYDSIMVTAGAPRIPECLIEQLNDPGRLVIPVGGRLSQTLMLVEKKDNETINKEICGCVFVPLVGEMGWRVDERSSN